jgi:hypothetical protein
MQRESDRRVERELAAWERRLRERGLAAGEDERRRRALSLEEEHRELPFAHVLGALTVLAIAAGARRARPGIEGPVGNRLLGVACAAAVGSVALVIALEAVFV